MCFMCYYIISALSIAHNKKTNRERNCLNAPTTPIHFSPDAIFKAAPRIVFLRHGNAAKAIPGQEDADRLLTDVGFNQAECVGAKIRPSGPFDLIVSSPAARARLTAMRATGAAPEAIVDEPLLGTNPPGANHAVLDEAFTKLGYASLAAYFESDATEEVKLLGAKAAGRILDLASGIVTKNHRLPVILVAGHAILLPAAIWAIGNLLSPTNAGRIILEQVTSLNLGEANAVELTLFEEDQDATLVVHTP